ncbi:MAG: NAD(P) transhydrogenase subunit alpha [Bacilli bacterium]
METIQIILLIIFFVASIVGYLVINNVPSLLHTPLMSGMNALSGVTILGALLATAVGVKQMPILSYILGSIAIISAMINVVGGFGITDRMLHIIAKRGGKHGK